MLCDIPSDENEITEKWINKDKTIQKFQKIMKNR